MSRALATYLIILTILPVAAVAQPESLRSDTLRSDSLAAAQADTAEPQFKVIPWKYRSGLDSRQVSGDSLLRWQNWPNWTYKKNRDPGVITYRLGTTGRSSAMLIDAHEPRHQDFFWEDIRLNDPVSGSAVWNMLPIHKLNSVYEDGSGIGHETNFILKQYYVNKPLTKLIFDESKFDRRALEFWVTQNFGQKTNAEISYWDRRGGGGYTNSQYNGRQIFARLYHQLDNRQLVKLRFLNGSSTLGEPFGYFIQDLNTFSFNRFSAIPNESSAESRMGFTTLALSYHRRGEDTTAVPENMRAGIYFKNRKRAVDYSADSTYYKVQTAGAFLHKWLDLNPIKVEGRVSYEQFFNRDADRSNLSEDHWSLLSGRGTAVFKPVDWWRLKGEASLDYRDGDLAYTFGAGTDFNLFDRLSLSAGVSRGTMLPTPQQLYWNSFGYSGSAQLEKESIEEVHGSLELRLSRFLKAGVKGQIKQIQNAVFVGVDSSFTNAGNYRSLSPTGYIDYSGRHFEVSASATLHRYQDYVPSNGVSTIPNFETERIWLKGSAYWKGYLFDRATYVKAGVSGMFAPQPYLSDHYNTVLDYWQPASVDQQLPWYSRLDVDLSARVRTIMFVLRYENVLDQVSQLGYFETANYPMPSRRFIFGVRAIFNN